ncbi:MAG: terminase large subunit [Solobacterium sp.]|jgi:phage terminase large subunit-like protein|nr:terminase large subunit [Solobacterium sp.]MCH4226775.1 terminase large subunit [Solobacterium sp.]MCH4281896.1 terminase large subunit [Solobacterium sp.]
MIKYSHINYIRKYWRQIESSKIQVPEKIKHVYSCLFEDLNSKITTYHFDIERAARPIYFIEQFCKQSKGNQGEGIKLELFQKAAIQAIFGFVDKNGIRKYSEVLWIMGRKNGKSTVLSAIALYMMIGDKEGGAEVDCVASKKDQAKIVFTSALNMVTQSPYLKKYIRRRKSDMYSNFNFGVFQPLASDSNTLDGLNPSCGVIDELHSIKDRNIYDTVKQGMTARKQPILFMITTAGFNREGIYDTMYAYAEAVINGTIKDEHLLPLIYELDHKAEWADPKMWVKANPGLGPIKSKKELTNFVERAKYDIPFRNTVWTKDFNLKNVSADSWLTYDQLFNPATFTMEDIRNTYAIGGCDLSATTDLTCATLLIRKNNDQQIYVLQHYFLPQERIDHLEHTASKEAPYQKWNERGLLTLCDGSMVNYSDVTAWFIKMRDEYSIDLWKLGYDRALAGYWADEMANNFGKTVMEKVAQGPFTWTAPMKELGAKLTDKAINYNANPMLVWCLSNTGVKSTGSVESIQPVKIQKNRRIDGMVSLLNAYVIYCKYQDEYLNSL